MSCVSLPQLKTISFETSENHSKASPFSPFFTEYAGRVFQHQARVADLSIFLTWTQYLPHRFQFPLVDSPKSLRPQIMRTFAIPRFISSNTTFIKTASSFSRTFSLSDAPQKMGQELLQLAIRALSVVNSSLYLLRALVDTQLVSSSRISEELYQRLNKGSSITSPIYFTLQLVTNSIDLRNLSGNWSLKTATALTQTSRAVLNLSETALTAIAFYLKFALSPALSILISTGFFSARLSSALIAELSQPEKHKLIPYIPE